VNRREMLTTGVRQLAQSLASVLTAAGGLSGLLQVRRAVAVQEEAASFPRRGQEPEKFSEED